MGISVGTPCAGPHRRGSGTSEASLGDSAGQAAPEKTPRDRNLRRDCRPANCASHSLPPSFGGDLRRSGISVGTPPRQKRPVTGISVRTPQATGYLIGMLKILGGAKRQGSSWGIELT